MLSRKTRTLSVIIPVIGAITALALTGCAPGASGAATVGDANASKILTDKKITLTIDTTTPAESTLAIAKLFEAKHPNITVNVKPAGYDDYVAQLPLTLSSDSSPDLALVPSLGNLAKNNLLLPLDSYSKLYGWDRQISASALAASSVGANKVTLGGDQLVTLPVAYYAVGLYYNKKLAESAGISAPPTTLDELNADLEKAKTASELPMQLGNKQGHAAFTIQSIAQGIDGAKTANDWIFGKPGQTYDTAANHKGVDTLLDWSKKGYLPPVTAINATDLAGAVTNFGNGQGVFFVDGNWDSPVISKTMGRNVGFVIFPGPHPVAAGGATTYAISAKSKHPNEAAAFLNFFVSAEAAQPIYDSGVLPNDTSKLKVDSGTVAADIITAFKRAASSPEGGLTPAVQGATSSMNNTFIQQTQELLAGQTTSDAFFTAIQADWTAAHGS